MGKRKSDVRGFVGATVLVPVLLINAEYSNIIFHQLYINHKVIQQSSSAKSLPRPNSPINAESLFSDQGF